MQVEAVYVVLVIVRLNVALVQRDIIIAKIRSIFINKFLK